METDIISQSAQAMSEVLKMAANQSTELAEKLIKINVQDTINILKDEMVGNVVDTYA